MSSELLRGESLASPGTLLAPSGHYRLQMQNDGNLVIYDRFGVARWATNTDGNGPSTLTHQLDSNIVVRRNSDNLITYASNTYLGGAGNLGSLVSSSLKLQDDGNLVLRTEDGEAIWASNTASPSFIPPIAITSELQEVAPSAIIELFEIELNAAQHGVNDTYRFHAGSNLELNGDVIWNGNSYLRFPVEADGFEYSGNGQLPRPTIRISNILSTITALLLTLPDGLEGAKVTRIRTLARYLDAVNFPPIVDGLLTQNDDQIITQAGDLLLSTSPGTINPLNTQQFDPITTQLGQLILISDPPDGIEASPDPTAEFPREIYFVDRKVVENRDLVEFELAAAFDLAGIRAPKRQCIANVCQWVYKSAECGYTGGLPTCDKTLDACKAHFGDNAELPYGSFPGIGAYTT
jgi:phage-related protein